MLNLKNHEKDDVLDEICKKKAKIKIQFQKKWRVFWIASSGEKSPNATDINASAAGHSCRLRRNHGQQLAGYQGFNSLIYIFFQCVSGRMFKINQICVKIIKV